MKYNRNTKKDLLCLKKSQKERPVINLVPLESTMKMFLLSRYKRGLSGGFYRRKIKKGIFEDDERKTERE